MAQGRDRWHVGKEIPIAVIVTMIMQTMGGVWFAATYVAKIDTLTNMVVDFKASQYTQKDAENDRKLASQRTAELERRIVKLEETRP